MNVSEESSFTPTTKAPYSLEQSPEHNSMLDCHVSCAMDLENALEWMNIICNVTLSDIPPTLHTIY